MSYDPDDDLPMPELNERLLADADPNTVHSDDQIERLGPDEERKVINAPAFVIDFDDYVTPDQLPPGEESSGISILHQHGSQEVHLLLPHITEDGIDDDQYVMLRLPIGAFVNMSAHAAKAFALRLPGAPLHVDIQKRPANPFSDPDSSPTDDGEDPDALSDPKLDRLAHLFAGSTPVRG